MTDTEYAEYEKIKGKFEEVRKELNGMICALRGKWKELDDRFEKRRSINFG